MIVTGASMFATDFPRLILAYQVYTEIFAWSRESVRSILNKEISQYFNKINSWKEDLYIHVGVS